MYPTMKTRQDVSMLPAWSPFHAEPATVVLFLRIVLSALAVLEGLFQNIFFSIVTSKRSVEK
jgi:hypothetical protein